MTFSILVLTTPIPTNKTDPTGGVHNPMHKFNTIIIPNCIGSIPMDLIIGRNMGVKINTAGVISINIPTNSNIRLIINNTINLFPLMFNIKRLRACGIFSKDITHDIHIEQVTKSKTMELVFVELKIILDSSLILISL